MPRAAPVPVVYGTRTATPKPSRPRWCVDFFSMQREASRAFHLEVPYRPSLLHRNLFRPIKMHPWFEAERFLSKLFFEEPHVRSRKIDGISVNEASRLSPPWSCIPCHAPATKRSPNQRPQCRHAMANPRIRKTRTTVRMSSTMRTLTRRP